ncbi:M20/M25/M40 family metallo-hydrolase [Mycolicibacterium sp. P9-64]|uniref:M28 family metallopeptidase n=1 Tax=Mycolicibacterium sp. P9-64 TaxID=2024612 RepID=UPI0011EE1481|nr:M28 family metallopeptidase [Mycolicibacterium sp. P9-64]KAA0086802.1 M20/M25/M40 family metallo-hydrolase [Mycolicibacterium sp. P9-64]
MRRSSRTALTVLAVAVVATAAVAGCDRHSSPEAAPSTAAADFAGQLHEKLTTDAMMAHLTKLQEIADANDGNRALGTSGYAASADYVTKTLRDNGFDVATDEFEVKLPFADKPSVTVGGADVTTNALGFTIGTPPEGVRGPLVPARAEDTPGCTASDYDGLPVSGAVVLVDRGSCPFAVKQAMAAERGAIAMIVVDNVDSDEVGGTLGEDTDVKIPVLGITKADGARLRANPAETVIKLHAGVRVERTHNVVAQTKTGSTHDVVMAGAHLDSVPEGPGVNDNGSGVAAVLETAVQLGSSPQVKNAVRFAFWGAEEEGLVGSTHYVQTLDADALKDVALYLNFDMLASPNPGYFTYDGDQSAPPSKGGTVPRVPEGSAGIERTLAAYLDGAGKKAQDTDFDGRSDYDAFTQAGIPSGGLFAGAEENMNADQAKLWGGQADKPFDPNYHKSSDTLEHIDRTALEIQGGGVAYAIGLYAQDLSGRNGIPAYDDRTRHVVTES